MAPIKQKPRVLMSFLDSAHAENLNTSENCNFQFFQDISGSTENNLILKSALQGAHESATFS